MEETHFEPRLIEALARAAAGESASLPLRAHELRVWICGGSEEACGRVGSLLPDSLLTPFDLASLARVSNAPARASRAFTRKLLRAALLCAHGPEAAQASFAEGPHGKPELTGISFNVSHSALWACVTLAQTGKVGIDVEAGPCNDDRAHRLAPRVFDEATLAHFRSIEAPGDRVCYFLAQWAAREAFLKCTGEGLSRDPRGLALAELRNPAAPPFVRLLGSSPALAVAYEDPAAFVTISR